MRLKFFLTLALLSFTITRGIAALPSLMDQAQAAWDHRDEPGYTEQAISLWEKALKQDPHRVELWIALTKAGGRATRHAETSAERRLWADRTRAFGEKAIALNSQNPDAFAYYGEALGQWAQAHKGLGSLKIVKKAVAELEHALTLNPHDAYAHMLLSEFYRQSPSVISIGDKAKALEHAKLAVLYGPGYAINHLVLARIDLDLGKKEDAEKELWMILDLTPPIDAIPETKADQATAREMLRSMGISVPSADSAFKSTGACSESVLPGESCSSPAH